MKIVSGNLLDATEEYIMHGCNCNGVMGSGVALAIKNKWPFVYQNYRDLYEEKLYEFEDPRVLIGRCQVVEHVVDDSIKKIINAHTQLSFGPGKQATYSAVSCAIRDFIDNYTNILFNKNEIVEIAIPYKFASDRGGLDWDIVKEIFEEYEELYKGQFFVTAYRLEEVKKTEIVDDSGGAWANGN